MKTTIYEAHAGMKREDFATIEEAKGWVETAGSGYVVTFVKDFDGRERSCAMVVYDREWRGVDISR